MPSQATSSRRLKAGRCIHCGKRPPRPGLQACQRCAEQKAARLRERRQGKGGKPWHLGGPGRPPKSQGGAMEPQCKPSKGPMRPEHSYDEDGICEACGTRRMAFAPQPEPRPLARSPKSHPGHAHKPGTASFPMGGRSIVAKPRAVEARSVEDVATIPDPIAATIAELDLWRSEIDNAIEVLGRLHARGPKGKGESRG